MSKRPVLELIFPEHAETGYIPPDKTALETLGRKIEALNGVSNVQQTVRGGQEKSYRATMLWVEGPKEGKWEELEQKLRVSFPQYAERIAPKSEDLQIITMTLPYIPQEA